MARFNLNEALKQKAAQHKLEVNANQDELALDDVSRVKVLSPGRKVFKRFIRNRLAIFGSALLITMFVLAFIGPLFYAYGQKEIFYKYDNRAVNYGMAKENTMFNNFTVDPDVDIELLIGTAVNSNVKTMAAAGQESKLIQSDTQKYLIELQAEDIYTIATVDAEQVCISGKGTIEVGIYSKIGHKFDELKITPDPDLEAEIKAHEKAESFEFKGSTITLKSAPAKTLEVSMTFDGILYTGESLGAEFEALAAQAVADGNLFEFGGSTYGAVNSKNYSIIYRIDNEKIGRVYSRLMVDMYDPTVKCSEELRVAAMLAAKEGGSFTAEGKTWSIAEEEGILTVRDSEGKEYMELSTLSVKRYSGEDSMSLDLKKAIKEKIEEMQEKGIKSDKFTYQIPTQNESGQYTYNEDGTPQMADTEMDIDQQATGEYVIRAEQVIYVIDRYADPSGAHILGTDGDGFDVFARLMYGGRISLAVGFVVVFLEIFLGIIMGGLAGYYGGWVDMVIMRLVDIFYCLPSMPIMIILGAMMDAMRMDTYIRLVIMMAALGIMGWAGVARMVRGQILSLREQEFMLATEASGLRVKHRIFHHLIPNVMPQLIVIATMGMGGVILTESTLSYLGLGVKHPLATWGTMINSVSSSTAMSQYPYIWIPVGLLICLTVIAFNFVGDGLRDAYDPRANR